MWGGSTIKCKSQNLRVATAAQAEGKIHTAAGLDVAWGWAERGGADAVWLLLGQSGTVPGLEPAEEGRSQNKSATLKLQPTVTEG